MIPRAYTPLLPFLALLFCGTLCAAMTVPYMAFFLVEGLGQAPWVIGLYAFLAVSLTVTINRVFGQRIDAGAKAHPLIGLAIAGYALGNFAIAVSPAPGTVLTLGVLGFGISSSAVSTMFSLGGRLAERHGLARKGFNAAMRATTSTAWMLGPAAAFLIADILGVVAVFRICLVAALLWVLLWWRALPHDITAAPERPAGQGPAAPGFPRDLWFAAGFIFCLSSAHSLTFSALPLFYVREVGLPGYAPGLAFSVKTFVEVFAIFSTPALMARFGMYRALLATALLAIATIQFLAMVQSFEQMLLGAALEGLYYGLYASLGISYIQSFAPERPAAATAVYWNTLMISGLMAGPAVGAIAQVWGFRSVIHVAAAVALCAFVTLLLGGRSQRRERPRG